LSDNKFHERKVSETRASVISVNEVQPHFAFWLSILVQFCIGWTSCCWVFMSFMKIGSAKGVLLLRA